MHLGTDLGLDSLGRVELLAAIETEPGVYLDESQVSEATTVEELKAMVARADQAPQRAEYWEWPLNWSVRLGRAALQSFLVFPLMHLVAPLKGEDKGQLKGLPGPVLFAANHLSHLDSPVVLAALPRRWRFHTAVAAAADVWFTAGRFKSVLAALLFNAFPFSRADSIRPSLEHCSRLLERGWSVLIYPEGTRSGTGQMGPFKSGTGLMAVELGVPVVPVHIQGTFEVMPKDQKVLRRGRVRVRFGQPLQFATRTSYAEATRAIEEAVRGLSRREERVYHAPTH
jgi:long-chain acyl-CoA synthetase